MKVSFTSEEEAEDDSTVPFDDKRAGAATYIHGSTYFKNKYRSPPPEISVVWFVAAVLLNLEDRTTNLQVTRQH